MMPPGAPLSEWLVWLETLSPTEIDLGLERVQQLLQRLTPTLPDHVLLIAGTNGKGSSVAMSDALLRATGKRVGAYTSPHIVHYNERIVVNGIAASDADIIAAFERIERVRDGIPLTYFEYGTLAAIDVFANAGLDVWLLEVGLGGRLDASNAIEPTASLITNISLDHCDWLGADVETIAAEKAGVMRPGVATVFGHRDVPNAITERSNAVGANLLLAGQDFDTILHEDGSWNWHRPGAALEHLSPPGLIGEFQIANAAAVLALLWVSGLAEGLDAPRVSDVLATLELAGRSQRIEFAQKRWIFDVAHNPAAAAALAKTLQSESCHGRTVAVLGLLDDKDAGGVVKSLQPLIDKWIAVSADSARATPANELARQVANLCNKPCVVAGGMHEAFELSRQVTVENDRIVVTGSFHTVGPLLTLLGNRLLQT